MDLKTAQIAFFIKLFGNMLSTDYPQIYVQFIAHHNLKNQLLRKQRIKLITIQAVFFRLEIDSLFAKRLIK